MADKVQHNSLTSSELHFSKIQVSTPVAANPLFIGQEWFDETNSILYVAKGTSAISDWIPVGNTGGVNSTSTQSGTTYTVLTGDNGKLIRLTNIAARTITLPVTPVNGFRISLKDSAGTAYTANITVNGSGFDDGANYIINSDYACFTFVYSSTGNIWNVLNSFIGFQPPIENLRTSVIFDDVTDRTKQAQFDLDPATTGTKTLLIFNQTVDREINFPDATDTLVAEATANILSNKSFEDPVNILAAQPIRFYNAGNTFYTAVKGGNNAANRNITWPTTAPIAGQGLRSIDTDGALEWFTPSEIDQQDVATAATITALSNATTSVRLTGATATQLQGIAAGSAGQPLTILNVSTALVTVVNQSGSASAVNRIQNPNNLDIFIPAGFSLEFQYDGIQQRWVPVSQLSASNIMGSILGTSAAAGFIGEQKREYATLSPFADTNWKILTSFSVTGDWLITGLITNIADNDPNLLSIHVGITTSSTTSNPADAIRGDNFLPYLNGEFSPWLEISNWYISASVPTTVYLNYQADSPAPEVFGRLSGIRVS